MKKSKSNKEDHDPKTCFRCRLHDLFEELKETNDLRFMLMSIAEAAGSILSQLEHEDLPMFMLMVIKTYEEDMNGESKNNTHH